MSQSVNSVTERSRERLSKWMMLGGGALALLALLGLGVLMLIPRDRVVSSQAVGTGIVAPEFVLARAPTGQTVSLSSLRGKPVWINFWATGCEPCMSEMADIKNAYTKNKASGLVVLGIDAQDKADKVNSFTAINAYDWTFLLDRDGSVMSRYNITALPTQIFIGRDGIVKASQVGTLTRDEIKGMLALITP
ncbi:MAG: TlpA family protein disulfide reductase [Chloroflexota bacterium]|nr:TlpA family protein disulfide reductase [Chloroflexota bacterium]